MEDSITVHILVEGKVQGVFFRATAKKYAEEFHIYGTVENLANGNVEIYASGTQDQLRQFTLKLQKQPGAAKVDRLQIEPCLLHRPFKKFTIL